MGAGEYENSTWTKLYVNIGGEKLAEYSDNKTYFYAHDHLGSPAVITDHTGAVVATYRHYPFGEEWIATGTKSERHRYTGAELDSETGLNYHGARYLSTSYARWTSVDPVLGDTSNPQRLNRYNYVLNDPLSYKDPNGKQECAVGVTELGEDCEITVAAEADPLVPTEPISHGFSGAFGGTGSTSTSGPGAGTAGGTTRTEDTPTPTAPVNHEGWTFCLGLGGGFLVPMGGLPVGGGFDGSLKFCIDTNLNADLVGCFNGQGGLTIGASGPVEVSISPNNLYDYVDGWPIGIIGGGGVGWGAEVSVNGTLSQEGLGFNGVDIRGPLGVGGYGAIQILGVCDTLLTERPTTQTSRPTVGPNGGQ